MKMSVKCDKMVLIPPSTNHWPQSEKASSGNEEAEKCPRCESSNTKFCYYNNYSLSQPRYFCKACKRYWTKGGTLRNVPVGGGCRKNKRATPLKRPSTTTCSTSDHITPINSSAPHINPLFYGFPNNNSMNLPLFPARFNYCNTTTSSGGFDDLEPGSVNGSANYNGFDSSCTMLMRNTISTTFEGPLLQVEENMQMGSDHEEVVASKDVKNQLEEHVPTTTTLYDPSSLYYWSSMPLSSMVGGVNWNNDLSST